MKLLLFGASGQVGKASLAEARKRDLPLLAPSRREADFTEPQAVRRFVMQQQPSVVINAAAYTHVDDAEDNADTATLVNATTVAGIAEACEALQIPCIHLSSDYVFDGKASAPYDETAATEPLNVYGKTKAQGERAVLAASHKCLVLRSSWIFSAFGHNFVNTMLQLGRRQKKLRMVADQQGRPTYAGHIAEIIFDLLDLYGRKKDLPWGIYHLADRDPTTWYDFAGEVFRLCGGDGVPPEITPIATEQFPTRARRPAYSVLNCSKLEKLLNRPMKPWTDGLQQIAALQKKNDTD